MIDWMEKLYAFVPFFEKFTGSFKSCFEWKIDIYVNLLGFKWFLKIFVDWFINMQVLLCLNNVVSL